MNEGEVGVVIPKALLARSPKWEPDSDAADAPPIALHEAIKLAKHELTKTYPNLAGETWSYSISLQLESHGINDGTYVIDKSGNHWTLREEIVTTGGGWVYCVRFNRKPPIVGEGPVGPGPTFPVAVLLDGTVIVPTKLTVNIDQGTLERDYDRLPDFAKEP